jgi:UDP-3-O-[3-hydroxymyristoyl] N-acetylglucosamine deacetylase
MKQATIRRKAFINGRGLHKGAPVSVEFAPAKPGSGIVFENRGEVYKLDVKYVSGTGRGTVIKKGRSVIHTVEHMLSAVKALGIDNLRIRIDGDEAPALDGSARGFAACLKKAGLSMQKPPKKEFSLEGPVLVEADGKYLAALPGCGFKVAYFADFSARGLKPEDAETEVNAKQYIREIAGARTFGFRDEIKSLKKAGLIRGADAHNAIVMHKGRPVNTKLRHINELARHKALDMIGDFAFIEGQLNMTLIGYKTGHTENIKMVKLLLKN